MMAEHEGFRNPVGIEGFRNPVGTWSRRWREVYGFPQQQI